MSTHFIFGSMSVTIISIFRESQITDAL